ncbi:MAG: NUDIX domain-containing protein [Vicinamibacterales bacterium]
MPRLSAGLLMHRITNGVIEVLLIHPGGPFWERKDYGAWSIPKGEYSSDENPLDAAMREFHEETGCQIEGPFVPLGQVTQASGKVVSAWAVKGDWDPALLRSNTFSTEWPKGSGRVQEFPEADRAAWFDLAEARRRINPGQVGLLDELSAKFKVQSG